MRFFLCFAIAVAAHAGLALGTAILMVGGHVVVAGNFHLIGDGTNFESRQGVAVFDASSGAMDLWENNLLYPNVAEEVRALALDSVFDRIWAGGHFTGYTTTFPNLSGIESP